MRVALLTAALLALAGCGPVAPPPPVPPSSTATVTSTPAPTTTTEAPTSTQVPPTTTTTTTVAPAPSTTATTTVAPPVGCAKPVVCTTADSTAQLKISAPGVYDGQGHRVASIMIRSAGVTVRNFVVTGGTQAGIWSEGAGNVIADNDISNIAYGDDDVDAMRFFGDGTQILRNRVHNLIRGAVKDAHPDCMQTYATPSRGASANVLIEGNDCRGFDFHQCLMAEGPGSTDGGGGGKGRSENWTIRGNTCEGTSNQSMAFRGVQNVQVIGNKFLGRNNKAIQSTDGSTVTPRENVLGPNVKTLIGG